MHALCIMASCAYVGQALLFPELVLSWLCRGKKVNTATVVTYTLGFTAAALVAILGYVYANRALQKIQARAQSSPDGQHSALTSDSNGFAAIAGAQPGAADQWQATAAHGASSDSQQAMLAEGTSYAADSPTASASSPSQHRLLQGGQLASGSFTPTHLAAT